MVAAQIGDASRRSRCGKIAGCCGNAALRHWRVARTRLCSVVNGVRTAFKIAPVPREGLKRECGAGGLHPNPRLSLQL